jgi:tetratricopeptide (TPR) repeat protein
MGKSPSIKNKKLLQDALNYCQHNQLNQAKSIYLDLIKILPNHPEVLTNLGTIEIQLGYIQEGINLLKRSLKVDPFQSHAIANLGNGLLEIDQHEDAIAFFDKAILSNPKNAENYYNKGRALRGINNLDEAILSYDKALELNSNHFLALNNRGFIFNIKGKFELALIDLDMAIKINPNIPEAYLNKGITLNELGNYQEAIRNFDIAIHINSQYSEAYSRRGIALDHLSEYKAAIDSFDKAILIDENFPEPYNGRAHALFKLHIFDRALEDYNKALTLNPNYYEALINKSVILLEKKEYHNALEIIDKGIKLKPNKLEGYLNKAQIYLETEKHDLALEEFNKIFERASEYPKAYYNASLLHLRSKRFNKGWELYEKRTKLDKYKSEVDLSEHLEKLESLEVKKKRILIINEQGLGDQILYLSLIRELDADNNEIIVLVDPRLIDLFKRSCPKIEFIPKLTQIDLPAIDYYSLSGSLGKFLRKSIEDFKSQPNGYLKSDIRLTEKLKKRLREDNKIICGLAWKSKNENVGIDKSIDLVDYLPILKIDKIKFINLQYGETEQERKQIYDNHKVNIESIGEIDNFNDIDGLASLVDACDIIVTTSNVTAHLAGALGKTVYLVVPLARGRIWYWHYNTKNSLWYPSVEQFEIIMNLPKKNTIEKIAYRIKESFL